MHGFLFTAATCKSHNNLTLDSGFVLPFLDYKIKMLKHNSLRSTAMNLIVLSLSRLGIKFIFVVILNLKYAPKLN